jgi:hypothetical protein
MLALFEPYLAWISTLIIVTGGVLLYYRGNVKDRLPPGPPGKPIVGNALMWPKIEPWKTFQEWSQRYGMSKRKAFVAAV